MFDPSVITSGPTCSQLPSHQLRVSWTSSAAAGTTYQLYLDGRLAWFGQALTVILPIPVAHTRIWVGAVEVGEETTNFSSSLVDPYGSGSCAGLEWYGGRYLDSALTSFRIFAGASPGAAPGSTALATVGATTRGVWLDGAGMGRAGQGGAGHAEVAFSWVSSPLAAGTWSFAIAGVDASGNQGSLSTFAVVIPGPPRPPAPIAKGKGRLASNYVASTRTITLNWMASPS